MHVWKKWILYEYSGISQSVNPTCCVIRLMKTHNVQWCSVSNSKKLQKSSPPKQTRQLTRKGKTNKHKTLKYELVKERFHHSPSSFSSNTGLFEELLAPILFFHLPQWNIDALISFLASWWETTALCQTPSSNERSQIQSFQKKILVSYFVLNYPYLFFWYERGAAESLPKAGGGGRTNVADTNGLWKYFTNTEKLFGLFQMMAEDAITRHNHSAVFRNQPAKPRDFVETASKSCTKLHAVSYRKTGNWTKLI